jgi:hypothetical protein
VLHDLLNEVRFGASIGWDGGALVGLWVDSWARQGAATYLKEREKQQSARV